MKKLTWTVKWYYWSSSCWLSICPGLMSIPPSPKSTKCESGVDCQIFDHWLLIPPPPAIDKIWIWGGLTKLLIVNHSSSQPHHPPPWGWINDQQCWPGADQRSTQLLHLILNFHLHWNIISSLFGLALQCQLIRHKNKHCNLLASTYPIMCSCMANCMLLSAELQTHQLLLCAWITQMDLQETLYFRKFCDFPCALCQEQWDLCAPRHSMKSTGWPLVILKIRKSKICRGQ